MDARQRRICQITEQLSAGLAPCPVQGTWIGFATIAVNQYTMRGVGGTLNRLNHIKDADGL
jgi:hypothetical protein